MSIGERIAFFRKQKGLTVNGLAYKAGVSQSYLRDIELGKNSNPTIDFLSLICDALGLTLTDFFSGPENPVTAKEQLLLAVRQFSEEQCTHLLALLQSLK